MKPKLTILSDSSLVPPFLCGLAAACGPLLAASGPAAEAPALAAPAQKPAWLTDLSLGLRESFDNNVFLSGVDTKYLAPGQTSLQDRESWVTTVSPKAGVNFAPLLGDQAALQVLGLAYAPDFVVYHDADSESYNAHRAIATLKGKAGAWSFTGENAFTYVDGSDVAPAYPNSYLSGYSTAAPRERRKQFQDRAKVALRYERDAWFARPCASLLDYDLQTLQHATATDEGYQNYCDRYDVNGGLDLGYKLKADLAVTLGYRYGHQYQQQYGFDPANLSATSDYQRVLVGLEGKLCPGLKIELQAGPDFRDYGTTTATHTVPVADPTPVKYYGEATLSAELSAKDSLTFKYKQWQWVSSTGKLPIFDSLYDLSYRRKLTERLGLELGGRIGSLDYTSADVAAGQRDDWLYTVSAGLRYTFSAHLSADLSYCLDLGRNAQDDLAHPETREFTRHLVGVGAVVKF